MLAALYSKFEGKKTIALFFLLTYADKAISFLLPLSVLFILKDKEIYSLVEVVFSYATIAMVLIELGMGNYLFYGYRNAENKDGFVKNAQSYFGGVLLLYVLVIFILLAISFATGSDSCWLVTYVAIRATFMLYVAFFSNIYRLKDNPGGIYAWTITANLLSVMLISAAYFMHLPIKLFWFFLPALTIMLVPVARFVKRERLSFDFRNFKDFLSRSLNFSWPIILNVLAMTYIGNYAKIYAYSHLSQQDMVEISYVMRIGLLVQLTHSAFSSYFSKAMFMKADHVLDLGIFKKYNLVLMVSLVLVVITVLLSNFFLAAYVQIPMTVSTLFFLCYILVWCYTGYLELYFGILNANRNVLSYSVISALIYTAFIKFSNDINVLKLAFFMFMSGLINLILVVMGLWKLGVLDFRVIRKQ